MSDYRKYCFQTKANRCVVRQFNFLSCAMAMCGRPNTRGSMRQVMRFASLIIAGRKNRTLFICSNFVKISNIALERRAVCQPFLHLCSMCQDCFEFIDVPRSIKFTLYSMRLSLTAVRRCAPLILI